MMNFILKRDTRDEIEKDRDELLKNIAIAYKEWKDKENYFEAVTDHDLIDYSIYEIEASRRKYLYLLKRMREIQGSQEINEPKNASVINS